MRNTLWWAVVGYVASVGVLLWFLYRLLLHEGFDETHFLAGAAAVLLLSGGWGYAIASLLIAPRQKMHERLMHVTDEILHELKIPLSTIDANATMIAKAVPDARTQKRLGRIRAATKRLERLYRELAYVLRKEIDAPIPERVDVAEILRERADYFNAHGAKRIQTSLQTYVVEIDRIGLEQTFDNLIENALKYSNRTSLVTLTCRKEGTVEIVDEGEGMDEAQLVRVFERYYRGESTVQGQGLGLTLVKRFCDENGIAIRIDSQKGKGTRVRLVFP